METVQLHNRWRWEKINSPMQHPSLPNVKTMLTVACYNLRMKRRKVKIYKREKHTLTKCVHNVCMCLAFQRLDNMASLIIYEVYPTWLTSKLSRFMADLGSLIMSSSFFSRVSILLSAPSDMAAASVVKSWVKYEELFQTVFKFTCETSLFLANGRGPSGAALGSQPTQIASNRNSVHNEEKIFPKQRLLASQNLPSERAFSLLASCLGFQLIKITSHLNYHLPLSERCIFQLGDKVWMWRYQQQAAGRFLCPPLLPFPLVLAAWKCFGLAL